ncbi:unnamed protein product [Boreogadus saida]
MDAEIEWRLALASAAMTGRVWEPSRDNRGLRRRRGAADGGGEAEAEAADGGGGGPELDDDDDGPGVVGPRRVGRRGGMRARCGIERGGGGGGRWRRSGGGGGGLGGGARREKEAHSTKAQRHSRCRLLCWYSRRSEIRQTGDETRPRSHEDLVRLDDPREEREASGWTSVSLLIKDSWRAELIDDLSGSVFHHYCPLPTCRDCRAHSQEWAHSNWQGRIRLAEVEQASLMSEQMSDKSSLALPDDLSLDEYSMYQLLLPDPPVQHGTPTLASQKLKIPSALSGLPSLRTDPKRHNRHYQAASSSNKLLEHRSSPHTKPAKQKYTLDV